MGQQAPNHGEDTERQTIHADDMPQARTLRKMRLIVIEGPDAGHHVMVAKHDILGGRSAVCDLPLTDTSISGSHFRVMLEGDRYLLRDEGSTNGTFYGDVRVREIFLRPGTVFRAGNTVLRFEGTEDTVTVALSHRDRFDKVIGASRPMREIFAQLERIAPSELTVLVHGETGTGKELIARGIHRYSRRDKGPFVVLDCSAIPRDLIESTLFGHERGAFTGAVSQRRGVFEQADGGTIFLDEIGELDLALQPKLLRVLESQELKRVGSDRVIKIDTRVVAATNRDLREMVAEGSFREDLFFRLGVVQVQLPPLRRRPDDIPILMQHFLAQGNERREALGWEALSVSDESVRTLKRWRWPGNVRELRNVMERVTSLSEGPVLTVADFTRGGEPLNLVPDAAPATLGADLAFDVDIDVTYKEAKQQLIDTFESIYLGKLVTQHEGNISRSARAAGLTRYHLRELMKKHNLHR